MVTHIYFEGTLIFKFWIKHMIGERSNIVENAHQCTHILEEQSKAAKGMKGTHTKP